jgi:hypothetical protein
VLELCASAHSHLPNTLQGPRLMVGQGMNSNEMAANPSLHQHFLQVRGLGGLDLTCLLDWAVSVMGWVFFAVL